MDRLVDFPLLVFVVALCVQVLTVRLGAAVRKRTAEGEPRTLDEYGVILGATLTLLALIIGFTFSMAIGRYDQRKTLEEAEANAIGTAYARAGLLPAADAAQVRGLLSTYLKDRILFYTNRDDEDLNRINERVLQLQTQLWTPMLAAAAAQPTPTIALAVASMNDVLNAQGYTQAAFWNRVPRAAWFMMGAIAICCSFLIGYGSRSIPSGGWLYVFLPFVFSIAFMLIADIDSARSGMIRVVPQNLLSLASSMEPVK